MAIPSALTCVSAIPPALPCEIGCLTTPTGGPTPPSQRTTASRQRPRRRLGGPPAPAGRALDPVRETTLCPRACRGARRWRHRGGRAQRRRGVIPDRVEQFADRAPAVGEGGEQTPLPVKTVGDVGVELGLDVLHRRTVTGRDHRRRTLTQTLQPGQIASQRARIGIDEHTPLTLRTASPVRATPSTR